jgi:branched-chain amino acid transport system substrate-binding protein
MKPTSKRPDLPARGLSRSRRPQHRTAIAIAAAFALGWAVTGAAGLFTRANAQETLRIGLSLPLTGNAAKPGAHFLTGARIAAELHNGDVAENGGPAVELAIADDGCDADLAQLAADEIAAVDPAIITGFLCNDVARLFAERFKDEAIPILVAGARSAQLPKDAAREGWNLWKISPEDGDSAEYAAEILSQRWAGLPFALVDDGTVLGRTQVDTFREAMAEKGLEPQFTDNFRPGQSTQARLVRRLANAGTRNVFVGGSAEDIAMIARNASELNIPLVTVGGETLSILPYLTEEDQAPAGLLAILYNEGPMPGASMLRQVLAEREIVEEDNMLEGFAAMQVAMAVAAATPADTTANLRSGTFDTATGVVTFKPDRTNAISPYGLFRWDGQQFERVE